MSKQLTHIGNKGEARMVDVSDKPVQQRIAVAQVEVRLSPDTIQLIQND